ncbi:hypothetical protein DFH07DRAFT_767362 [Mycena maculata]|uniref:Uncharacterized protein n=1 Tax=Mycena maculata TaxID=230809 RepID=A0AAD7JXS4_9AGAR|nr:hypothetical protein DFH07DRAFT_767362 [Mycena maculata]
MWARCTSVLHAHQPPLVPALWIEHAGKLPIQVLHAPRYCRIPHPTVEQEGKKSWEIIRNVHGRSVISDAETQESSQFVSDAKAGGNLNSHTLSSIEDSHPQKRFGRLRNTAMDEVKISDLGSPRSLHMFKCPDTIQGSAQQKGSLGPSFGLAWPYDLSQGLRISSRTYKLLKTMCLNRREHSKLCYFSNLTVALPFELYPHSLLFNSPELIPARSLELGILMPSSVPGCFFFVRVARIQYIYL